MTRVCTVCSHEQLWEIDLALVRRDSYRGIAKRYGVSDAAVTRHCREHLPAKLLKAQDAQDVGDADLIAGELQSEKADIKRLKSKAEKDGDYRTALSACDKALKALELQAKLAQLISEAPTFNLYLSAEWVELRAVIVGALESHPAARECVLLALEGVGNGKGGGGWDGA